MFIASLAFNHCIILEVLSFLEAAIEYYYQSNIRVIITADVALRIILICLFSLVLFASV